MPGTSFAWTTSRLIRHLAGTVPHRGGKRMRIRTLAVLVASLSLMTVGCATKKFVREEISKSEAKTGSDIGKVDSALSEEKTRTTAMNDQLGQTNAAVQQADGKAT